MERSGSTHLSGEHGRSSVRLIRKSSAIRSRERIQTVSTVIVDRSAVFRAGLIHALSGTQFRVVAEGAHLQELEKSMFSSQRNLFLVNVEESIGKIDTYLSSILKECNKNYLVLLGNALDDEFDSILGLKCNGYMSKNEITLDFLVQSLNVVVSDGVVLSPNFMNKLRSEWVYN
jgi:DNA-binding NarL/FixJ family response regulator